MKKTTIFITSFLVWIFSVQAQHATIQGKIYNSLNNEVVQNAHIQITGTNFSTTSNENGFFILKGLEVKKYKLKISHILFDEHIIEIEAKNANFQTSIYLNSKIYEKEMIIVTATRSKRNLNEVPGNIVVITRKEIDQIPAQKIDDIIKYASGLNTSRNAGIFSMRPTVTLRGLSGDEQGRTLVLIDGSPINKGDTGGVNWNRIDPDQVERIEIYKGPGSSLYGNNAMGGVINIITHKPKKLLKGQASVAYGTYNTKQIKAFIESRFSDAAYVQLSAFYTNSDGYNLIPENMKKHPDYSIARFLKEKNISVKAGYKVNKALNFELHYDYFEDKRGEGEKIKAPIGEYRHFNTHFFKGKLNGNLGSLNYNLNVYYQKENYFKLDERMKKGSYQRFDVNSDRIDKGANLNFSNYFKKNHIFSFGGEVTWSSVDGGDHYKSSADFIVNRGKIRDVAFYVQDEVALFDYKIRIQAGIRYDKVKFYDGNYESTDGAWTPYLPPLKNHEWSSLSPKIAISYELNKSFKTYVSVSKGFRASILDDLCRSGWMWVGPKIANPELGPENILNYEIGVNFKANNKFSITPTLFYARGKDFLYYVQTGNLLWGKRPIYQRQNITEVNIYGLELDVNYKLSNQINIIANYTFNDSRIGKFNKNPSLDNKFLKFAPKHQAKAGVFWNNKIVNTNISAIYKGKQFSDDKNNKLLDDYITFDLQLSKTIKTHYTISLSVHDLLDNQHMETDLYLSPGRIINFKIAVKF